MTEQVTYTIVVKNREALTALADLLDAHREHPWLGLGEPLAVLIESLAAEKEMRDAGYDPEP